MAVTGSRRRLRSPVLVGTAVALATAVSLAGQDPARSAPSADCPAAVDVSGLAADQPVHGLTVSKGTDPDPFTGKVVGVINDGIFPGIDMVMVRLTSPEIDRVGGIWGGMSGSPVYDANGDLIGAVSYGLALGPSPVAGVTPAAAMEKLLDNGGAATAGRQAVHLSPRAESLLRTDAGVSARQAASGFTRLPTPVAVSGLAGKRLKQVTRRLDLANVIPYSSTAAAAVPETPQEAGIVPGGNLGASLSYGDFSVLGIGTVTMVCGDEVVGFGHPFWWGGKSTLTLHGADAVYVQEDPTLSPFKVANPTGPVGTIDQDRIAGVSGPTGTLPDTTKVTSKASADGRSRTGTTFVSVPTYLPDLATLGVVYNQLAVLDKSGEGSAHLDFTVSGTAGGHRFSLHRGNRFTSQWDIAYESPFEIYATLSTLLNNKFTDLRIDSIDVTSRLTEDVRQYSVGKVQQRRHGSWVTVAKRARVTASPGQTVRLRVTLNSFRDRLGSRTVFLNVPVPAKARAGSMGQLVVRGGNSSWWGRGSGGASSFGDLVKSLENRVRNDQVVADLGLSGPRSGRAGTVDRTRPQPAVVGGRTWFRLVIRP
jgi:hypothetical protein